MYIRFRLCDLLSYRDRIVCSRYDSIIYKKKLRDNGVELLDAVEANVEGSGGIIVEGLMEALAEYYSAELAEKVRRGMRESALKGKAIGSSRPPWPYRGQGQEVYHRPCRGCRCAVYL